MKSSKTNILIATGIFPPQVGGPATYSKLLQDKLPQYGFDIKVENFGDVIFLPKIIRHFVYFFRLMCKMWWSDIVYAQDPVSVGFPALLAAKITGKKFYLKIVGDYAWEQGVQRFGVKDLLDAFSVKYAVYHSKVKFLKKIQLFVACRADKIIVPSLYLKKIVGNWGVPPKRINVIYNAFDKKDFKLETKEDAKKKLGIDGKIIVSAGRLVPWKGFDTLISVMPKILEKCSDTKLYIIGQGPDRVRLENLAKENGTFGKMVEFTGYLSKEKKLFQYIQAADLFVLNTSYEGFSHQILEVLAFGTPLITTKVGGNVEIIKNNENGILLEYNDKDAIISSAVSLLTDSNKAGVLIRNGQLTIERYSEENMLHQLVLELRE